MVSKTSLAQVVLCAAIVTNPAAASGFEPFAFAQLTAESTSIDDAVGFGADAIRAGFRARSGAFTARVQLDFNAGDLSERQPGTLPNVIKDVDVVYSIDKHYSIRFGQFKAPIGYDFLRPGFDLDIAKRGMEKGLVLERTIGMMFSGRKLANGLGYDIGVFNPAGRSAATRHIGSGVGDQTGDDLSAAARVFIDPDKHWHAELSLGTSQNAGGPATEDYKVADAAVHWRKEAWSVITEYTRGTDVRGVAGHDVDVWYVHAGFDFSPTVRGVLRHYAGTSELSGVETDLRNTWIGVTYFLGSDKRSNSRVMLNYIFADGDKQTYTGVGGFGGNALFAQYQFHYTGADK